MLNIVLLHISSTWVVISLLVIALEMSALVLFLLWSLVEVHSQPVPYVSFMGENLPKHSYVDLSLVGSDPGNIARCHTDLTTCCGSNQGIHHGDWYFPDRSRLGNSI